MQTIREKWRRTAWRWFRDEEGIGTLEVVLIAAVIIAIVILFRGWITEFLQSLFERVEERSDSFFS